MSMPAVQHPHPVAPEEAWGAVQRRDPRFDGQFVYAVSSTGVYCRPSCPSRRPSRDNVSFFAEPLAAEHAGYRECLRCRPKSGAAVEHAVAAARRYLEAHAEDRVTLDELARHTGISAHHLQRVFKAAVGLSPREYHDALRVGRLRAHLRGTSTVSRATYDAGYGSSSRVYEHADAKLGMTPGAYRRGGAGVTIAYEIVDSPLGRLLVGVTDRGVCSVALGDNDVGLVRALRHDFPRAEITRGAPEHRDWIAAVVDEVSGRAARDRHVPIDVQGTAFQWQVWRALQQVPRGRTTSYSALARSLGRPTAARAVARACASNRVAVLIPCHRVVREDGELGGYKWGVERKKELLAAEQDAATRSR